MLHTWENIVPQRYFGTRVWATDSITKNLQITKYTAIINYIITLYSVLWGGGGWNMQDKIQNVFSMTQDLPATFLPDQKPYSFTDITE